MRASGARAPSRSRRRSDASRAPSERFDGFVALGCVIRGETTHYDHICAESARGLQELAVRDGLAIGYGILTCENEAQALARAALDGRDHGGAAVRACLAIIELKRRFAPGASGHELRRRDGRRAPAAAARQPPAQRRPACRGAGALSARAEPGPSPKRWSRIRPPSVRPGDRRRPAGRGRPGVFRRYRARRGSRPGAARRRHLGSAGRGLAVGAARFGAARDPARRRL